MKILPATLSSIVLVLAASACGSEVVKKVEEFADRACACADAACAKGVHQDFMKFIEDNSDKKGSEGDRNKVQTAAQRLRTCVMEKTKGAPSGAAAEGAPAGAGGAAEVVPPSGGATPPVEVVPPSGGATPPPAEAGGAAAPAGGAAAPAGEKQPGGTP